MRNSPSPEEIHRWDRQHFIHPWHDMNAWRGYDNMLVEGADGIYMYDETGKQFIDGPAACGAFKLAMVNARWQMQLPIK